MILPILALAYFSNEAFCQDFSSPCPANFYYEPQTENDKWYGVIVATTLENLTGLWITITLDSKADLLGNWFGETYSTDNTEYRISNPDYVLEAGPPVSIRFFVKYSQSRSIPHVQTIRLNGKTICSHNESIPVLNTTPRLHISKQKVTRRPSEGSAFSYEPNDTTNENVDVTTIHRPTNHSSSNSNDNNDDNSSHHYDTYTTGSSTDPRKPSRESGYSSTQSSRKKPSVSSFSNDLYGRPSVGTSTEDRTINGGSTHQVNSDSPLNNDSSSKNNNVDYGESIEHSNTNSRKPTRTNQSTNNADHRTPSKNKNNHSGSDSEEDYFLGDFNLQTYTNGDRTSKPARHNNAKAVSCGTVTNRPRPLITDGQDTVPGEWPWHVAIYRTKGIQLVYICGGSLISEKIILTAAHCVTKARSNKMVEPETLLVYLGKYNLKTFGAETQDRDVADIYVHPDYNYTLFYNDIAIIKLNRPAEITDYVRPCCLWEGDTNLENVLNKEGTVIGWGFDKNKKISEKLMQAKMPIVSTIQCIYSNRDFFSRFTFDKNFCAGFRNGTSVCNGDSGGSLVFPRRGTRGQNTVWQIRGIVSVGVALQSEGVCDPSEYVIFTDVAKYLTWINQILDS